MTSLNRRHFLQGIGAAVAIPSFSSLRRVSSLHAVEVVAKTSNAATTATGAPLRMAFMSIPNGVQQDHWFPIGTELQFDFNKTMEPLEPLRKHVQVIGGLNHEHATPGKDGAGDHARANATFLTGARARKTAGKDIHVGISVDQLAAQKVGHLTRFPSLELSCDAIRNTGSCDSGYACAYQYNLAWSSPTTPVTPEPNPRLVFERLFGVGKHGERRISLKQRQESQKSILDFVLEDATSVRNQLGKQDKRKLDEYLSSVRSIEKQIESAERFGEIPDPNVEAPSGIPDSFGQHMDMMYDLMALAFQTDSTRIATLLLSYDGSNRVFPELGIREGHHHLTHNQRKRELALKVAQIDKFYMERFARFVTKLSEIQDTDGNSVLHNSMIVYGGAIADGNRHTHENLPVVVAGQGGGDFSTNRYLKVRSRPMSNMFVSMLNHFGVPTETFGDSHGLPVELT